MHIIPDMNLMYNFAGNLIKCPPLTARSRKAVLQRHCSKADLRILCAQALQYVCHGLLAGRFFEQLQI